MKKNKGMALIASMIIVLVVSIVAVAIASTSASNRIASFSTYDTTSSYANSQAGINLGEVILMTASTEELDSPEYSQAKIPSGKIARKVSDQCNTYTAVSDMLSSANSCFWWVGNTNSFISNSNFMSVIGSDYYDSSAYPNAQTRFKLEERSERRTKSLEAGDKLGRKFYRITSVGYGNTEGLAKIQGQIGVYSVIATTPQVDENATEY